MTDAQRGAVRPRLLADVNRPQRRPGLTVIPQPQSAVSYDVRTSRSGDLQIEGKARRAGTYLAIDYEHKMVCDSRDRMRIRDADGVVQIEVIPYGRSPYRMSLSLPWAIDGRGRAVPTRYEVHGSMVRQIIDARRMQSPIVFDPTYSTLTCAAYSPSLDAGTYLDMNGQSDDVPYCPHLGIFTARNPYMPGWGYEANVASTFGKVIIYPDGGCSAPLPNTGPSYDFTVPCKAHDYCYDLRKAGFSGTVSDGACDDALYALMEAHCEDRSIFLKADCYLTRDIAVAAVKLPMVVTNPDPAVVEIRNQQTGKCAEVEGPSSADGAPIQQWSCLGNSNQQFRIWPAPNAGGQFNIKPVSTNKCVRVVGITVFQQTCDPTWTSLRMEIFPSILYETQIRDNNSGLQNCWLIYGSYANGDDVINPACGSTPFNEWNISKPK